MKSTNPRVTVILPVYNAEPFLRAAVQSVLDQTYSDFELLAIDDGSSDGSLKILQSFNDPRMQIIAHSKNQGLITSLNEGLAKAKGSYIARMDADDIAMSDRFSEQVKFLDAHDRVAVLGTACRVINEKGKAKERLFFSSDSLVLKWHLLFSNPLAHPSVMFRRDVALKAGGYRAEALHCEDYDLWVRLADLGDLGCLPEELLFYRRHHRSVTSKQNEKMAKAASMVSVRARSKILGLTVEDRASPHGGDREKLRDLLGTRKVFLAKYQVSPRQLYEIDLDISLRLCRLMRWPFASLFLDAAGRSWLKENALSVVSATRKLIQTKWQSR